MADESLHHDEDGPHGNGEQRYAGEYDDRNEMNDTYADFDDDDSDGNDPSETREEYDSEDEGNYQKMAQQSNFRQRMDQRSRFSPQGAQPGLGSRMPMP